MLPVLTAVAVWEGGWWLYRKFRRRAIFDSAVARANALKRPVVVIGAPDSGPTAGPSCGDITVDITDSACPRFLRADITKHIPLPNDSVVVFISCVLEYVDDIDAAKREILRIAGDPKNVFNVYVEPWTLTAWLYPGTKRRMVSFP